MNVEQLGRLVIIAVSGAAAVGLCAPLGGCVRAYQPLSGLHRPVAVNPALTNFEDVRLTVRCVPGGLLNPSEANALCQKVGQLFENQGATVTTEDTERGTDDTGTAGGSTDEDPVDPEAAADAAAAAPTTDLTLELRAREVHSSNNLLSWLVCLSSFTVVPAVTESTFAQDVVVRDGTGFLLLSDTLEGRLVQRFGVGSWVGTALEDATRKKEDRLGGDAANRNLSADLYRQLSQLVFNAKMEWQVLQQVAGPAGTRGRSPAGARP